MTCNGSGLYAAIHITFCYFLLSFLIAKHHVSCAVAYRES